MSVICLLMDYCIVKCIRSDPHFDTLLCSSNAGKKQFLYSDLRQVKQNKRLISFTFISSCLCGLGAWTSVETCSCWIEPRLCAFVSKTLPNENLWMRFSHLQFICSRQKSVGEFYELWFRFFSHRDKSKWTDRYIITTNHMRAFTLLISQMCLRQEQKKT